jgi:hypothetical protein
MRESSQPEVEDFDHALKEHGRERAVNHSKVENER